jgi:hypothetical protein
VLSKTEPQKKQLTSSALMTLDRMFNDLDLFLADKLREARLINIKQDVGGNDGIHIEMGP